MKRTEYTVYVEYADQPGVWLRYTHYWTLHEALATFHKLEGHADLANVSIRVDGKDMGIIAR